MASKRDIVRLQSTESSHFYTTTVSRAYGREKLRIKKFDPIVRRHVWYQERRGGPVKKG